MKIELHADKWECHECGANDVLCNFLWFDNLCQHFVSLCDECLEKFQQSLLSTTEEKQEC